jgi:hypothetical protein
MTINGYEKVFNSFEHVLWIINLQILMKILYVIDFQFIFNDKLSKAKYKEIRGW